MSHSLFSTSLSSRATPAVGDAPLSVSQVNQRARRLMESSFARLSVRGEVSNFKKVSGHSYFTLKDGQSQLAAVLFRREATHLKFEVRPGMELVATGRLTIYEPYGRYQMVCDRLDPCGEGALQAAFEQLKQKLAAEGLFGQERKRSLPMLPGCVAVVTSPTGAVIRDIIHVSRRRDPSCQILVVPTKVQGAEAAADIAAAVESISGRAESLGVSVTIVARGGGSLEDLWGFNDERVARAIVSSSIPVVSAVGHETDFTIADFVADCRAPTPSSAAEVVFPIQRDLVERIERARCRMCQWIQRDVDNARYRLQAATSSMGDGYARVRQHMQRLSYAEARFQNAGTRFVLQKRLALQSLGERLAVTHPRAKLVDSRSRFVRVCGRVEHATRKTIALEGRRLSVACGKLGALSPLGVLERGYGIVFAPNGEPLKRSMNVEPGAMITARLSQGSIQAEVRECYPAGGDSSV